MVSITAADLQLLVNDSTISAANCEGIIDESVDTINLFLRGNTLSNMTGVAGSKTLTVDQNEKGGILNVATEIYFKRKTGGANSQSVGIGGLSMAQSSNSSIGSGNVLAVAEKVAAFLQTRNFQRT